MDEQNPKLYPAWRQVEADLLAAGLQDGATISMDYLRRGLGLSDPRELTDGMEVLRQQAQFNFAMGELKQSLLENHRIKLRLVDGVGYMVVPPSEQTRLTLKDRGAEILNALNKAVAEVTCIRTELLTEAQLKENADALARFGALRSLSKTKLLPQAQE